MSALPTWKKTGRLVAFLRACLQRVSRVLLGSGQIPLSVTVLFFLLLAVGSSFYVHPETSALGTHLSSVGSVKRGCFLRGARQWNGGIDRKHPRRERTKLFCQPGRATFPERTGNLNLDTSTFLPSKQETRTLSRAVSTGRLWADVDLGRRLMKGQPQRFLAKMLPDRSEGTPHRRLCRLPHGGRWGRSGKNRLDEGCRPPETVGGRDTEGDSQETTTLLPQRKSFKNPAGSESEKPSSGTMQVRTSFWAFPRLPASETAAGRWARK